MEAEKKQDGLRGFRNSMIQQHMNRVAALAVEKEEMEQQIASLEEELNQYDADREKLERGFDMLHEGLDRASSLSSRLLVDSRGTSRASQHDEASTGKSGGEEKVTLDCASLLRKIEDINDRMNRSLEGIKVLNDEKRSVDTMIAGRDESIKQLSLRYTKLLKDHETLQEKLDQAHAEASVEIEAERARMEKEMVSREGEKDRLVKRILDLEESLENAHIDSQALRGQIATLEKERVALETERADWLQEYMSKLEELSAAKYQLEARSKTPSHLLPSSIGLASVSEGQRVRRVRASGSRSSRVPGSEHYRASSAGSVYSASPSLPRDDE